MMSELGKKAKIPDIWIVSVLLQMFNGSERGHYDEIGRESQGEGGAIHDQQCRANEEDRNRCTCR